MLQCSYIIIYGHGREQIKSKHAHGMGFKHYIEQAPGSVYYIHVLPDPRPGVNLLYSTRTGGPGALMDGPGGTSTDGTMGPQPEVFPTYCRKAVANVQKRFVRQMVHQGCMKNNVNG